MAPLPGPTWAGELPGGLIDAQGRRLARVRLRPLSGAEEEWLATTATIPSAVAVTNLLAACLVHLEDMPVDADLVRRFLVGDRDFLMLQLRLLTLGDPVHAVLLCPACSAKMDVDFAVRDLPVERRPQTTATHEVDCGKRTLRFRLPTGGDQEAVLGMDLSKAADMLMERCLTDRGSAPLSSADRAAVADTMDRLAPQVDLDLDLACPECGHAFTAPFDMTAFFLQEMRLNGKQLLQETHLLAFHYHWSEAEILGLPRERRRAYLALLRDAVRPG
jgi:hypothetical protein